MTDRAQVMSQPPWLMVVLGVVVVGGAAAVASIDLSEMAVLALLALVAAFIVSPVVSAPRGERDE